VLKYQADDTALSTVGRIGAVTGSDFNSNLIRSASSMKLSFLFPCVLYKNWQTTFALGVTVSLGAVATAPDDSSRNSCAGEYVITGCSDANSTDTSLSDTDSPSSFGGPHQRLRRVLLLQILRSSNRRCSNGQATPSRQD